MIENVLSCYPLLARSTFELLGTPFMEIDMLLQVCDLCVGLLTALNRADEGLLPSVNPEMVEDVLDLFEEFSTPRVVTGEHGAIEAALGCHGGALFICLWKFSIPNLAVKSR